MPRQMSFGNFSMGRNLRVVKFSDSHALDNQALYHLRVLVEECEDMYPGIDIWFKKKVKTGFTTGERSAFLVYQNNLPVAGAILRKGNSAKLCSMRILDEHQGNGLGTFLMSLIAAEAKRLSERIHFTAPFNVWRKWEPFFRSLGFTDYGFAETQYRLFDDELICGVDFNDFWKAIIRKLPQTIENLIINDSPARCDLVLSVKPTFAERIVSGAKKVEVRRRFPDKWEGATVLIYSSSPARQFVGEAVIERVVTGPVREIWAEFSEGIGCSKREYMDYCNGTKRVSALIFSDVFPFKNPISKSRMQETVQRSLFTPQSYCKVDKRSAWPTALSLSCLMRAGATL